MNIDSLIHAANSELMVSLDYLLLITENITDSSNKIDARGNILKMDFTDFNNNRHKITIKKIGKPFEFYYQFTNNSGQSYEPVSYWITDIYEGTFIIIDRMVRNIAETSIDINSDLYKSIIDYLDMDILDKNFTENINNILIQIKSTNLYDIYKEHIKSDKEDIKTIDY